MTKKRGWETAPSFNLELSIECPYDDGRARDNVLASSGYPRVEWGKKSGTCVVAGRGPRLADSLDKLVQLQFQCDIYALNDAAGYLSDHGVESYMCACDATDIPFKTALLVKGALFASRVHPNQFALFDRDKIQMWDIDSDAPDGIVGGGSIPTRAIILLLKMGYSKIEFFGCEGCFHDTAHVGGSVAAAYNSMLIIRCGERIFTTVPYLLEQCKFMVKMFELIPDHLVNRSGGLLAAMLETHGEYDCIAIAEDLKDYLEGKGVEGFEKYGTMEDVWRQQRT